MKTSKQIEPTRLLTAQDILPLSQQDLFAGFNRRIFGESQADTPSQYWPGWMLANEMVERGEIYATHVFKCSCGAYPVIYGGAFCCNACGHARVDEPWWVIRITRDGSAFMCNGLGFVNLQESGNYAFGDTAQEAREAYERIMRSAPKAK
jgi:hypothetical protein